MKNASVAVGDVLALSVSTPAHLKKIGLLDNSTVSDARKLNIFLSIPDSVESLITGTILFRTGPKLHVLNCTGKNRFPAIRAINGFVSV